MCHLIMCVSSYYYITISLVLSIWPIWDARKTYQLGHIKIITCLSSEASSKIGEGGRISIATHTELLPLYSRVLADMRLFSPWARELQHHNIPIRAHSLHMQSLGSKIGEGGDDNTNKQLF